MRPLRAACALLVLIAACSDDVRELPTNRPLGGPVDGATPSADAAGTPDDAGTTIDAGNPTDGASTDDAAATDAGTVASCDACPRGSSCLRDVCVDTCGGADLGFTDVDLAPELRPQWASCARFAPGIVAATARQLLHAAAITTGRRTDITLTSYPLSAAPSPAPVAACSVSYAADRDGVGVRLYPQLGLSPRGRWAHFGIIVQGPAPNFTRLPGRFYSVELGTCATRESTVESFGGAVMLSEEPDQTLILRSPPNMQPAIYRGEQLVAQAQVWVTRYDSAHVLASLYTGHGGHALSAFTDAALLSGPYPVRGGESSFSSWPTQPAVLADGDLIGRGAYQMEGWHYRYDVDPSSLEQLGYTEPTPYASETFFGVAPMANSGRVALVHARGVLVVE